MRSDDPLAIDSIFELPGYLTYLHAADAQCKADTQVVAVGPFGRKNGV